MDGVGDAGAWENAMNLNYLYWEEYKKRSNPYCDTRSFAFYWYSHKRICLALLLLVLGYVTFFENTSLDTDYNIRRGVWAVLIFFILASVTVLPDGPFSSPHPLFWRAMLSLSIVYEFGLIFLLFQCPEDAKSILKIFDPSLVEETQDRRYGGNCKIYDDEFPADPLHNIRDKMDVFVPMHFIGWWVKTLVLRDWWMSTVISVMFEILEYSLEHQLPNFNECWWDHWVLDVLICNGIGIWAGMKTLKYFRVRKFNWRGFWNVSEYRHKLNRMIGRKICGRSYWLEFQVKPMSPFQKWAVVMTMIFFFLLAELNGFYMKFVLRIPSAQAINLARLFSILSWGAVSLRETFQYLDDPSCKIFGRQAFLCMLVFTTEFLVVAKYDFATISKMPPCHITVGWIACLGLLFSWAYYHLVIKLAKKKKSF